MQPRAVVQLIVVQTLGDRPGRGRQLAVLHNRWLRRRTILDRRQPWGHPGPATSGLRDRIVVHPEGGGADGEWSNLDAVTGTSQTFSPEDGSLCGASYEFRAQSHGDGETHLATWSEPSEPVSHTTEACN